MQVFSKELKETFIKKKFNCEIIHYLIICKLYCVLLGSSAQWHKLKGQEITTRPHNCIRMVLGHSSSCVCLLSNVYVCLCAYALGWVCVLTACFGVTDRGQIWHTSTVCDSSKTCDMFLCSETRQIFFLPFFFFLRRKDSWFQTGAQTKAPGPPPHMSPTMARS